MVWTFCLLLLPAWMQDLPILEVGQEVEGEITLEDPVIESPILEREAAFFPRHGQCWQLTLDRVGEYTIEAHSRFFDGWLQLRRPNGELVDESDGDWFGVHPRLRFTVDEAPVTYRVELCALRSEGPFRIAVKALNEPELEGPEQLDAWIQDSADGLRAVRDVSARSSAMIHALWNRAHALNRAGRSGEARAAFLEMRGLAEEVYREAPARLAWALLESLEAAGSLGDILQQNDRALELARRAHGDRHRQTILALANRALLLSWQGKTREAVSAYEELVPICEEVLGEEHLDLGSHLANFGGVLIESGRWEDAARVLERAVAILGGNEESARFVAIAWQNLGVAQYDLGELVAARQSCEQALLVQATYLGAEHPEQRPVLNSLAAITSELGDLSAAREYAEKSLRLSETLGDQASPSYASALERLATIEYTSGDRDRARDLQGQAVARFERSDARSWLPRARARIKLATMIMDTDLDSAWENLRRAIEELEGRVEPGHLDLLNAQRMMARAAGQKGDLASATRSIRAVTQSWKERVHPHHPLVSYLLEEETLLLQEAGRVDEARAVAFELFDTRYASVIHDLQRLPDGERFAAVERLGHAVWILLGLRGDGLSPDEEHGLHARIAAWKGLALRSSLRRSQGTTAQWTALAEVDSQLSRLASGTLPIGSQQATERLSELVRTRKELLRDLREGEGARDVDAEAVQRITVAAPTVDFLIARRIQERDGEVERSVVAWVLTPESGTPRFFELGPADEIEQAVEAYLKALGVSTSTRDVPPARTAPKVDALKLGAAVRERLWDPLAPMLGDRDVIISPDGFLAKLPLESLPIADDSYLLAKHRFQYRASLRDSAAEAAGPGGSSLLCIAGVDYGVPMAPAEGDRSGLLTGATRSWEALTHTEAEGRAVLRHFQSATGKEGELLAGRDATEAAVKARLADFRYLHFATHGYFLREALTTGASESGGREGVTPAFDWLTGLRAGVVLAGANAGESGEHDDGLLTAQEVAALDLRGVRLAVLSACRTALGVERSGEGLLGLRRAFHQAGVRQVISSVWSVPDAATQQLMGELYRRMWEEGESPGEALRNAQLQMLRAGASPKDWGGFVYSGAE
ncbi:MAG: CHAT domain-containing tetratricopeptide repeat protein [Planctomycetota bacterium]